MKLQLKKSRKELEGIFKTTFNNGWENTAASHCFSTNEAYPIITNERPVKLKAMHWGFPLYLDDNQTILKAIAEVGIEWVLDKPMFESISDKRCLIPLEINDDLKYGAGVWDIFADKQGSQIEYFALLTTKSAGLNTRIPYLLEGAEYKKWLSPKHIAKSDLQALLK